MSIRKHCNKCGHTKDAIEFSAYTGSKDGLQPWCKACHIAYSKSRAVIVADSPATENICTHNNPTETPAVDSLLIASDPREMAVSQTAMMTQVSAKIDAATKEARDAHDMIETMRLAKLDWKMAERMHKRATSRVGYLVKIHKALSLGYLMMPDMPGTVVAVRTNQKGPRNTSWVQGWTAPQQKCASLPVGEGRYVSPRPKSKSEVHGSEGAQKRYTCAVALRDPDGLDHKFVRPEVISRTAGAMTAMVFDEIATVIPTNTRERRDRDPIVLGRIVDEKNHRVAAFLVAWFVDTVDI